MKRPIYQILEEAEALPTPADRVRCLQENDCVALRQVLHGIYSPNAVWLLPEGPVPPELLVPPDGMIFNEPNRLHMECRRMYLFAKGGRDDLAQGRREQLFVEFVSYLPKGEQDLIISMKDKKCPYPKVTKEIVEKAFPDLL